MTLTDPQYKTLLDAQAICRHLQNTRSLSTAANAADEIERLIERCEQVDQQQRKEDVAMIAAKQAAPF